jgi:antitoxin ParD1/3/4
MNLSLRPEHQQLIESQINSGRYTNSDEIIAEALELLIKRDRYNLWVEEVRHKVEVAAESLDRGEGVDGETAIAQIRARLHQRSET